LVAAVVWSDTSHLLASAPWLLRCVQQLRAAGYVRLANEVELAKASKFLGNKEFESAIAVFKVGTCYY